jgi:signal transduction histidine kinase
MNPVVKITKTANSITTEKLDNLLPLTGRGDEIDELSEAFNDLFSRIKADFDRERQFSSDVSHELNTPLTVISGQTNLLLRWGKDKPEQLEKSLHAIKDEATSMHAIIENLLQISRIESGRIKPETSEINVYDLFKRVAEEFNTVQDEIRFEISCPEKITLVTDGEMLHQIFTILVSNSIKFFNASEFASSECVVTLSATEKDDKIILEESDNGPGIQEEALPHIFERFYRADEAHSRKAGGSGLGLAIAHTLADSLGATIEVHNVKPHGAGFVVVI